MYFDTYDEALAAAIKQSTGKLADTKLYVKFLAYAAGKDNQYKIGFFPDAVTDAYVYNGEVKVGETT